MAEACSGCGQQAVRQVQLRRPRCLRCTRQPSFAAALGERPLVRTHTSARVQAAERLWRAVRWWEAEACMDMACKTRTSSRDSCPLSSEHGTSVK